MIIECPSCHTKFSVDSDQIADIEDPRFHCCRCGSYFSPIEELPPAEAQPQSAPPKSEWAPHMEAGEEELFEKVKSRDRVSAEQLTLLPDDEPPASSVFRSAEPAAEPQHAAADEPYEPLIRAEWPDSSPGPAADSPAPHSPLTSWTIGRALLSAGQEKPKERHQGKVAKLLAQAAQNRKQAENELEHRRPDPGASEENQAASGVLERERRGAKRRASKHQRWIAEMERRQGEEHVPPQKQKTKRLRPSISLRMPTFPMPSAAILPPRSAFSPNNAPVLFVCSLPLLLVALLSYTASRLELLPESLVQAVHLDTEELPRVPPEGLGLTGLRSQVVTLDNGKQVLEVRGQVLNGTERVFKKLNIEAALFDARNRQLGAMQINPSNELQDAKLQALDTEAIAELQTHPVERSSQIMPNSKHSFRLVFPVVDGKAQWFSARVYTVFPA